MSEEERQERNAMRIGVVVMAVLAIAAIVLVWAKVLVDHLG